MTRTVYYKDHVGNWHARTYKAQCSQVMHPYTCRCQGVVGHTGDHWAFAPDGSLRLLYAADLGVLAGCMASLFPGDPGYHTPEEMMLRNYRHHHTDSPVKDFATIDRLLRDECLPGESVVMDAEYARTAKEKSSD